MILVDTSVLVDAARGHTDAQALIRTSMSADEPLTASVLTKVEMLRNVRSGERRRLRRLFDALEMQPVTDVVAEHAGALARQYRSSTDVCGTARLVGLTVLATLLVGCGEQPIAPQAQPDLTARDNAQVSPLDDVPTWPVKVRYVVERRLDDQDYLERTEHEFAARSWDDWTDITIASSVRGENSTARGAVARWANGRYVGGILPDVASVGQSEFLPEATWRALEDSLQVAVDDAQTAPPEQGEVSDDHLPRAALEPDRPRAPSDVFNVGLATPRESDSAVRPLSPAEEIEAGLSSGPAADLEAVAGRLGLSADRLRRAALVHRVCADDLASCERWVTVYDPHTQIPLAVEWHLVGGERITLEASVVVLGAPDTPRGDS